MSFEEGIRLRNILLFYGKKYHDHLKDREHVFDQECLCVDPCFDQDGIHIKIFYGTRKESTRKGYIQGNYIKAKKCEKCGNLYVEDDHE